MDKYFVYRPLLDLISRAEGTAPPKRNYNETLGYGAYTGGNVNLVTMTLKQVDALQTSMLRHKNNKWNSSALGRYQIIRTTIRSIKSTLGLSDDLLFDEEMQDRMACFLLGQRGIDKWLNGNMQQSTLINNLAAEWASLPKWDGKGAYSTAGSGDLHKAQSARVSVQDVQAALNEVKKRNAAKQPANIPKTVDEDIKKDFNLSAWLGGLVSSGGIGFSFLSGMSWQSIIAVTVSFAALLVLFLILRKQIFDAIKEARNS